MNICHNKDCSFGEACNLDYWAVVVAVVVVVVEENKFDWCGDVAVAVAVDVAAAVAQGCSLDSCDKIYHLCPVL